MKISMHQVSVACGEYFKRKRMEADMACPEPKRLVQSVMHEGSRRQRRRVLDHAAECPECARFEDLP